MILKLLTPELVDELGAAVNPFLAILEGKPPKGLSLVYTLLHETKNTIKEIYEENKKNSHYSKIYMVINTHITTINREDLLGMI